MSDEDNFSGSSDSGETGGGNDGEGGTESNGGQSGEPPYEIEIETHRKEPDVERGDDSGDD